jgi:Amt family ammonium transporter
MIFSALAWLFCGWTNGWAQDGRSTEDQVEKLMQSVPGQESAELMGLRRFSSNSFDAGQVAIKSLGVFGALFLVAPGLAVFYWGLSNTIGKPDAAIRVLLVAAVLSLAWPMWIYSLAFTRSENSFDVDKREIVATSPEFQKGNPYLGGLDHLGLRGLDSKLEGDAPAYPLRRIGDNVPQLLVLMLELTLLIVAAVPLAIILPSHWRIVGVVIFFMLWATVVYAPGTYWVWGGGWHAASLDSAGGLVIHLTVGCSALGLVLAIRGESATFADIPQANLPWLIVGTILIWAGSLLVNVGHAPVDSGISANVLLASHLAACTGIVGWTGSEWLKMGRSSANGICCGAVAGLTAISSGCGVVPAQSAMIIGLVSAVASQLAYRVLVERNRARTKMAPFALHAIGGGLGALLTGCFATSSVGGYNPHGDEIGGLLTGNFDQLLLQASALLSVAALAFVGTYLLAWVTAKVCGARRTIAIPYIDATDIPR